MTELEKRYFELYEMTQKEPFELPEELKEEYNAICSKILKEIMNNSKDIFVRLRNR